MELRTKNLILFLFSTLILMFDIALGQEPCYTATHAPGQCIPYQNCQFLRDMYEQRGNDAIFRDYLLSSRCMPNAPQGTVYICCQDGNSGGPHNYESNLNQQGLAILERLHTRCGPPPDIRLSGGEATSLAEFPWMALLRYDTPDHPFRCGGSLITSRYVLTAAHCLKGYNVIGVRLGEHDIDSEMDCQKRGKRVICSPPVEDYGIEKTILHEQYGSFQNDIALIKLNSTVDFQRHIKPICLPISLTSATVEPGQKFYIAGWGTTESGSSSKILLKALVDHTNRQTCQSIFKSVQITQTHLCASGATGVDTCKGDSGGPLFFLAPYRNTRRFVQFGVVSFGGTRCANDTTLPGIYANVVHLMPWITNNIDE